MSARIGILGAGQLGMYLCRAAHDLGFKSTVLAPVRESPAANAADQFIAASYEDVEALTELVRCCDAITFEIENIPSATLKQLERLSAANARRVSPSASTMLTLQNKAHQKSWLIRNGFPTPKYLECDGDESASEIAVKLGLPFVQKRQRGGYDGLGVQVIRQPLKNRTDFWREPSIAEEYVVDARELAVIVARNAHGEVRAYPVAEMVFDGDAHILRHVVSPAPVGAGIAAAATKLAVRIVQALQGEGVFAVEMFLTRDQSLLINEISPRVHNAGHLTLEASLTSQFEQHLRAIVGMPLRPTQQLRSAAMVNILYEPDLHRACLEGTVPVEENASVHWYGKRENRPGRKMGHITCLANDGDAALAGAVDALARLRERPEQAA